MIVYVNLEHRSLYNRPDSYHNHLARQLDLKFKFEEISGMTCLVQNYNDVSLQWFRDHGVKAMIISGAAAELPVYEKGSLNPLFELIKAAEIPILGLCGGHQIIGVAQGAKVNSMRKLRPGEADPTDLIAQPDYFKEVGFMPFHIIKQDPIFKGIQGNPTLMACHFQELNRVPRGFELLASTEECEVQVIKQSGKPVYGFQFHPEAYTEGPDDMRSILVCEVYPQGHGRIRPDGRAILENFFRIADIIQ